MKNSVCILLSAIFLSLCANVRAQSTENTLRPGDTIVVKLSGAPTEEITVVSNSYDISDRGTINLPYLGELKASGMKPSNLQKAIEGAYKNGEIFTHPTIQVTYDKGGSPTQVIFVSGEVKMPKPVPMTPGLTVQDALTSAGGPTDFAKLRAIKFTRGGATRILDCRKADSPDSNLPVQSGDKIHVPQ